MRCQKMGPKIRVLRFKLRKLNLGGVLLRCLVTEGGIVVAGGSELAGPAAADANNNTILLLVS